MARRKNRPEAVQEKCQLSVRLRQIRAELFGERGGSEMARRLGIPVRTWYNYESGVTVPAEVLLRFLELSSVEPLWLLRGRGPKYRPSLSASTQSTDQVRELLRTALEQLSRRDDMDVARTAPSPPALAEAAGDPAESFLAPPSDEVVMVRIEEPGVAARGKHTVGPPFLAAGRDLVGTSTEASRCVRVDDDAMAPLLSAGAYVAYSDLDEEPHTLAGNLVVAWVEGRALVRWLELAGRYAILRAENSRVSSSPILLDLEDHARKPRIRRVIWTNTPHH